jgi:hypothetical protein
VVIRELSGKENHARGCGNCGSRGIPEAHWLLPYRLTVRRVLKADKVITGIRAQVDIPVGIHR